MVGGASQERSEDKGSHRVVSLGKGAGAERLGISEWGAAMGFNKNVVKKARS